MPSRRVQRIVALLVVAVLVYRTKTVSRMVVPFQAATMSYVSQQSLEVNNYPCIYAKYPNGWGNNIIILLDDLLQVVARGSSINDPFPCVLGYGDVFSKLFSNLEACPSTMHHTQCYRGTNRTLPSMKERRTIIFNTLIPNRDEVNVGYFRAIHNTSKDTPFSSQLFQQTLKLNATFIDHVFEQAGAPHRLHDLQSHSCAVHVRFGDPFFRPIVKEKDRRFCGKTVKGATLDACFSEAARRIDQLACPNRSVPLYLATDMANFSKYFCDLHPDRVYYSSCESPQQNDRSQHIVDVELVNVSNGYQFNQDALPPFWALLSDWLSLVFAQELHRLGHSTFSELARLNYYTDQQCIKLPKPNATGTSGTMHNCSRAKWNQYVQPHWLSRRKKMG